MKRLLITLFVLALAVSTLAVAGCGGGNGDGADSPEKVVERFMQATIAGDADTVYDMLTESSKAEITDRQELVEGTSEVIDSYSVGKGTVSGERASVPTTIVLTELDSSLDFQVILLDEGGSWKISLDETSASLDQAFERWLEEFELPE
jgi:hypothetical protein